MTFESTYLQRILPPLCGCTLPHFVERPDFREAPSTPQKEFDGDKRAEMRNNALRSAMCKATGVSNARGNYLRGRCQRTLDVLMFYQGKSWEIPKSAEIMGRVSD